MTNNPSPNPNPGPSPNPDPNPNPGPNPSPGPVQQPTANWKKILLIAVAVLAVLAAGIFLIPWGKFKTATKPSESPAISASAKTGSNEVQQVMRKIGDDVASATEGLTKVVAQLDGSLNSLAMQMASNQVATDRRIEALRMETVDSVSRIQALRAETLDSVTNIVETSVARAMERFQRLLILTNPSPAQTVVTQFVTIPPVQTVVTQFVTIPPPVFVVTPPPLPVPAPVVALAKPVVTVNNSNMVTKTTGESEAPSVVIYNQNLMGGGPSIPPPQQPPAKTPYWERKLW